MPPFPTPAAPHAAVIFGAPGGIGAALCARLRASGTSVLAVSRSADNLRALSERVPVDTFVADATNPAHVAAAFHDAQSRYGRIDATANLVGSFLLKPAHLITDDDWTAQVSINLSTAFFVLRAAVKVLSANPPDSPGGSIVLMSSAAARIGLRNHEAVAAAKGGVQGLTLAAAATYAPRSIRVNAVAPGLTRTPMTQRLTSNQASLNASSAMHALGRIAEADEAARAVEWLLSPESSFITGQFIGVDGGLSTLHPR